jgi:GntR family transcriptional regulator/MocR family aminotransferase
MLPWQTIISIEKDCDTPVFLQIANSIIQEMKKGRIGPGIKLPGTRQMSELVQVHRKTVVRAYEELDAQGWIEMHPSKFQKSIPVVSTKSRRSLNFFRSKQDSLSGSTRIFAPLLHLIATLQDSMMARMSD